MAMSFPNETTTYRAARDALLASEVALRRQMEAVAAELRALPPGGEVPEDYAFAAIGPDGTPIVMRMSELFRGGDAARWSTTTCSRATRETSAPGLPAAPLPTARLRKARARLAPRSSTCGGHHAAFRRSWR